MEFEYCLDRCFSSCQKLFLLQEFLFLIEYPIPFIKLEMFIVWVHCKIYLLKNVNIPLKITKKMLFTHVYMYDYIILVRICSSFH